MVSTSAMLFLSVLALVVAVVVVVEVDLFCDESLLLANKSGLLNKYVSKLDSAVQNLKSIS